MPLGQGFNLSLEAILLCPLDPIQLGSLQFRNSQDTWSLFLWLAHMMKETHCPCCDTEQSSPSGVGGRVRRAGLSGSWTLSSFFLNSSSAAGQLEAGTSSIGHSDCLADKNSGSRIHHDSACRSPAGTPGCSVRCIQLDATGQDHSQRLPQQLS